MATATDTEPDTAPLALTGRSAEDYQLEEAQAREDAPLTRLRPQLRPLAVAAGVYAAAGLLWGVTWTSTPGQRAGLALLLVIATIAAWPIAGRAAARRGAGGWTRRVQVATLAAGVWLAAAVTTGPSWDVAAVGVMATVALSARWWRYHRIPDMPTQTDADPDPAPAALDEDQDTGPTGHVPDQWARHVSPSDGLAPGCQLTGQEQTDQYDRWTVELTPGRTVGWLQGQALALTSALDLEAGQVMVEPHPSRRARRAQLTVVTSSPVSEPIVATGPSWHTNGVDGWAEVGWYADGADRVRISLYSQDSMHHVALVGAQGSGKTGLMNLLTLSAMSSGCTCVLYLDGQDGASSPMLTRYAHWSPSGPRREAMMLEVLERIVTARNRLLRLHRLSGFTPDASLPGILVVVDEISNFFRTKDTRRRWAKIAAEARKLAVGIVSANQSPSAEAWGGSDTEVRDLLWGHSYLVLKSKNAAKGSATKISTDDLPGEPGWGRVGAGKGVSVREAMFRADYLPDSQADALYQRYAGLGLDEYTARALPAYYHQAGRIDQLRRRQLEADVAGDTAAHRQATAELEAIHPGLGAEGDTPLTGGQPAPALGSGPTGTGTGAPAGQDIGQGTDTGGQLPPVPVLPAPPVRIVRTSTDTGAADDTAQRAEQDPGVPDGLTDRQTQAWRLIQAGHTRWAELTQHTGWPATTLTRVLDQLVQAGHIARPERGVYTTREEAADD